MSVLVLLLAISFNAFPDTSCTGGGTMYVCGREQIMQAVKDADTNCTGGFATKVLIDVCTPNMQSYTIY